MTDVISGVPHGAVLGPVLFLVHILGIYSNVSLGTQSSSFADDTRIWRGVPSPDDCSLLQKDLESVLGCQDIH